MCVRQPHIENQINTVGFFQNLNTKCCCFIWKYDKYGCYGYRSLEIINKIIETNRLVGKDVEKFINYFGAPNKIKARGNLTYYIYYLNGYCDGNGDMEMDVDKSWTEFEFFNDTLTQIPNYINME